MGSDNKKQLTMFEKNKCRKKRRLTFVTFFCRRENDSDARTWKRKMNLLRVAKKWHRIQLRRLIQSKKISFLSSINKKRMFVHSIFSLFTFVFSYIQIRKCLLFSLCSYYLSLVAYILMWSCLIVGQYGRYFLPSFFALSLTLPDTHANAHLLTHTHTRTHARTHTYSHWQNNRPFTDKNFLPRLSNNSLTNDLDGSMANGFFLNTY